MLSLKKSESNFWFHEDWNCRRCFVKHLLSSWWIIAEILQYDDIVPAAELVFPTGEFKSRLEHSRRIESIFWYRRIHTFHRHLQHRQEKHWETKKTTNTNQMLLVILPIMLLPYLVMAADEAKVLEDFGQFLRENAPHMLPVHVEHDLVLLERIRTLEKEIQEDTDSPDTAKRSEVLQHLKGQLQTVLIRLTFDMLIDRALFLKFVEWMRSDGNRRAYLNSNSEYVTDWGNHHAKVIRESRLLTARRTRARRTREANPGADERFFALYLDRYEEEWGYQRVRSAHLGTGRKWEFESSLTVWVYDLWLFVRVIITNWFSNRTLWRYQNVIAFSIRLLASVMLFHSTKLQALLSFVCRAFFFQFLQFPILFLKLLSHCALCITLSLFALSKNLTAPRGHFLLHIVSARPISALTDWESLSKHTI